VVTLQVHQEPCEGIAFGGGRCDLLTASRAACPCPRYKSWIPQPRIRVLSMTRRKTGGVVGVERVDGETGARQFMDWVREWG